MDRGRERLRREPGLGRQIGVRFGDDYVHQTIDGVNDNDTRRGIAEFGRLAAFGDRRFRFGEMLTTRGCGFANDWGTATFRFGTNFKTMPAVCWQRERYYLQTIFGFGRTAMRPFTDANFRTVRGGPGNFTCMWTLQEGGAFGDDVALLADAGI